MIRFLAGSRGLIRLLAGAALLLGVGATVVGVSLPGPRLRLAGGNFPVNPGAADRIDLSANNSPTIVRNPVRSANVVEVNRLDRPQFACALNSSFDGGASWAPTAIPFPEGEEAPPRCFAPDATFGADGTLYVSFVTLKGTGNVPSAGWLTVSSDGGRTLSTPNKVLGPLAFQVRVTADPKRPEQLYLSWLQASETVVFGFPDTGNPILLARSDDSGKTWGDAVRVSPPSRARVVAPSVALGPHGDLYLLYLDLGNDRLDYGGAHGGIGGEPDGGPWALVVAHSADSGATWREAVVDGQIVPTERIVVFTPPSPSLAVDPRTGRVYVAYYDGRDGDADVFVWASADGTSFNGPVRVNDTRRHDGTSQYLPRLAVAPNGRLDVVYYDRRADPANIQNNVSFQSSFDSGRSFTARLKVSDRSFDSRIGLGRGRNLPDLGSRLGLLSTNRRALAMWSDTRSGTDQLLKQDIAAAVVAVSRASSYRGALPLGGLVVAAAALAVLAGSLISRRTPSSSP